MKHKIYPLSLLSLLASVSLVTSCGKTSSSTSSTTESSSTSSPVDSSSAATNTQQDFLDFQKYMRETVLSKDVKKATFTETNSQDGYENRVRTTKYGVDEVFTTIVGNADYLQYAAIRDGIYYTAIGSEDGVSVSRQLITDKTGASTTTEEVARNTLNRYLEIADFRETEIFDVFTTEDAVATLFKKDGDVITLSAYRETDSIYNYAYTIVLNINDQDEIVSLEGQVDFADSDHLMTSTRFRPARRTPIRSTSRLLKEIWSTELFPQTNLCSTISRAVSSPASRPKSMPKMSLAWAARLPDRPTNSRSGII